MEAALAAAAPPEGARAPSLAVGAALRRGRAAAPPAEVPGAPAGGGAGASGAAGGAAGAVRHRRCGAASCTVSAAGEMTMSLAGGLDLHAVGRVRDHGIDVPGGGWVAQGFRVSSAQFQERMVTIPNLGRPQATDLEFGAVNHQAALSVDGTAVATNTRLVHTLGVRRDRGGAARPGVGPAGLHPSTSRAATPPLHSSSGKKLVPDAAGWSSNLPQGIFRSAVVRVVPALHVSDAFVRTDVASDKLSVDVWVRNDGTATASGTVDVALSSWNCDPVTYPTLTAVPVSVPAGMTVKVTVGPVAWGHGPTGTGGPTFPTPGLPGQAPHRELTVTTTPPKVRRLRPEVRSSASGRPSQVGDHYELNGGR